MCFEERKKPACCVGMLSAITFIIAVVMIVLSVRFNNSGLSTELGSMGDYANGSFYFLLIGALVALAAGICGLLSVCIKNRIVVFVFGLTLFPAAMVILITGGIVLGVSSTKEDDLKEFCFSSKDDFD